MKNMIKRLMFMVLCGGMISAYADPATILPYHDEATTFNSNNRSTSQYTYLFSHGLGGKKENAHYYKRAQIINDSYVSFDYPDAQHRNLKYASLAQEEDLASLRSAHKDILNSPTILMGVSRGASAILNFTSLDKPTNVKAIIVESPFDSINTVLDYKTSFFGISLQRFPFVTTVTHWALRYKFPKYKKDGMQPIHGVSNIPFDIPILIVCTKKDTLVPWYSSKRLYQELKKSGRNNVHILIVETGEHGFILRGNSGNQYQYAVHAFYKKYDLPHNEQLAQYGEALFSRCQP